MEVSEDNADIRQAAGESVGPGHSERLCFYPMPSELSAKSKIRQSAPDPLAQLTPIARPPRHSEQTGTQRAFFGMGAPNSLHQSWTCFLAQRSAVA